MQEDYELMSRLADIGSHLRAWAAGNQLEGSMAADALDQLRGHVEDASTIAASDLLVITELLKRLPPPLE